ncbi:MAG: hypothetical protein J2O46_10800 [Nocardioides sp.]|nr:hypothetical protein [Nocardioides sp.]
MTSPRLPYDDPDATDVLRKDCAAADHTLHLPEPRVRGVRPHPEAPYDPDRLAAANEVADSLELT